MIRSIVIICFISFTNARHFDNPVLEGGGYADPGVILKDGVYYAATTSENTHTYNKYPINTSTNLQNWTFIGYIFNESNFPAWSDPSYEFYAPEFHEVGGQFLVYFTSRDRDADVLVIGVATSKNVAGPYTPLPTPLVIAPVKGVYVLDSTLMRNDETNTLMLAWVESQYIRIRNLSADGLSFADNNTVPLFQPELPWEGGTVEGPWYIYRNGYHYIFYSGNGYCSDKYALGVARSRTAAGPYEKYPDALLVSNADFKGPGHGSIVRDIVNDGWAFVHHAWRAGEICEGYFRAMLVTSMEWGDDDWPKKMSIGE